jgi:hypothetical protein
MKLATSAGHPAGAFNLLQLDAERLAVTSFAAPYMSFPPMPPMPRAINDYGRVVGDAWSGNEQSSIPYEPCHFSFPVMWAYTCATGETFYCPGEPPASLARR